MTTIPNHIVDGKAADVLPTDYEAELQDYVNSLPLVAELKASPNVVMSRELIKMYPEHQAVHLTHRSLATPDTIPVPPIVFQDKAAGKLWVFYRLGSAISGHHKVVHGGLSATLLDEVMGIASLPLTKKNGIVTAQLNVKYKVPIPTEICIMVRAEPEKIDGRKFWMNGWIEDPTGRVMVESNSLFIEPRNAVSQTDFPE